MGPAPRTARCGLVAIDELIDSKLALSNSTVLIGTGVLFSTVEENPRDTRYAIASASKLLMAITTPGWWTVGN